ncbi:hypothetical protein SARC_04163 [Sphaeroforma arctica JP610]|uniref:IPT/TIG domain-containing protein n=1 Tax=Sphaeroforma arctica JP610 TaxID=667725 RepID=A0A0L0G409_9EUKA|nr:hypothetical protein SARC_04163 [Sphaeroforma arctica JP610]KNC83579.1 hypothetical protein SARC_04163 [Sphaeroforma arctica JP610]|eukprot:XP_014157481.1 hypothetical protein SARC_04163 [Sphaeroforma arctica JP610]
MYIVYAGRSLLLGVVEHPIHLTLKAGAEKKQTGDSIGTSRPIWNEQLDLNIKKKKHNELKIKLMVRTVALGALRIGIDTLPFEEGDRKSWYGIFSEDGEKLCEVCMRIWISAQTRIKPKSKMRLLASPLSSLGSRGNFDQDTSRESLDSTSSVHHAPIAHTSSMLPSLDITSFTPTSGPPGGIIVIRGDRLGMSEGEINTITVAGHTVEEFEWKSRAEIRVSTSEESEGAGRVVIWFKDGDSATSDTMYTFTELGESRKSMQVEMEALQPDIQQIFPERGSEAGCQVVTIDGESLGNNHDDLVYLSVAGWLCDLQQVTWKSSNCIKLLTPPGCGRGPVVLVTVSGGPSTTQVEYTYSKKPLPLEDRAVTELSNFSASELQELATWQSDTIKDLREYLDKSRRQMQMLVEKIGADHPETLLAFTEGVGNS